MTTILPKISIIVPIYNAEQFLRRCIDSILAQTFTDFELLLIDDGGKDRSSEICDEYAAKDSHIKVFHKENGGVSSARNLGLDMVKGKWINFIDSDDWIDSTCLERCYEQIEEDDDLLMFSLKWAEDCRLPDMRCDNQNSFIPIIQEHINRITFTTPVCKLFKTAIIKKNRIRFDTNISSGEDTLFFLTYFKHVEKMRLLPQEFYNYDTSSSSDSLSKRSYSSWGSEHYLMDKIFSEIKEIESKYGLSLMEFRLLFSTWRINKFLRGLPFLPISEIRMNIHQVSSDAILRELVRDERFFQEINKYSMCKNKARIKQRILRFLLYTVIIKYKMTLLPSLYVKYIKN